MAEEKKENTEALDKLKAKASKGSTIGIERDRNKSIDKQLDELGAKAKPKAKTQYAANSRTRHNLFQA